MHSAVQPSVERESRLGFLLQRASRRRLNGALLTALSSGLLSGDPDNTEALFVLAGKLEMDGVARRRALSSLLALARLGEPGALSLLAWLGDGRSRERLAELVGSRRRSALVRTAAIRGALFVLRAAHSRDDERYSGIDSALAGAAEDDEPLVRYSAAFVRASLGYRDVRGCLERGALEERDPDLLRLCLLGIESVGDANSLPFVWRVWMRHPDLRGLADAVSERLEEDLRRRQVNLLADGVERGAEVQHGRGRVHESEMPEVVVTAAG